MFQGFVLTWSCLHLYLIVRGWAVAPLADSGKLFAMRTYHHIALTAIDWEIQHLNVARILVILF